MKYFLGLISMLTILFASFSSQCCAKEETTIENKIALGNQNSPIKVYFISDWFCPSCKRVEPDVAEMFAQAQSQAAFYFIDYTLHRESLNYSPYNLAFLIQNKPQYFKLRGLMQELTDKEKSPKDKDIKALAKKANVDFKELPYSEIKSGLNYYKQIAENYEIKSTPVLVVVNTKNKKVVKFQGASKIKDADILEAIKEVKE